MDRLKRIARFVPFLISMSLCSTVIFLSMVHKQQRFDKDLSFMNMERSILYRKAPSEQSTQNPILVALLDPRCDDCGAQLNGFENHLSRFHTMRLIFVFLTSDTTIQRFKNPYSALSRSPNVAWGTLDDRAARRRFNIHKTPHFILFDAYGELHWRFSGEIRCEAIIERMKESIDSDLLS